MDGETWYVADLDPSTFSWMQAGGVVAFAGAVLLFLRDLKPLLKDIRDEYTEIRTESAMVRQTLNTLLQRDALRSQVRSERRSRETSQPDMRTPIEVHDEVTGQVEEMLPLPPPRPRTPVKGVPLGAYSHYPKRGNTNG